MKKILFSTMIAATLFTSAFAAETDQIFLRAEHNLQMKFKNTGKVEWSNKHGMMKATFFNNGKQTEAFFAVDGQLMATCKIMNADEVPTYAKIKLAQKYAGFRITEAINYSDADGEAIYVSAEKGTEKVIIKSQNGIASVFQKSLKS